MERIDCVSRPLRIDDDAAGVVGDPALDAELTSEPENEGPESHALHGATDLDRLMDGRKADLCFTDSPYNVDYTGGVGAEKAGKGRRIMNDALGDGSPRRYVAGGSAVSPAPTAERACKAFRPILFLGLPNFARACGRVPV